jgi:hypothetical protein
VSWYDPSTWVDWSAIDPTTKRGRQNIFGGVMTGGIGLGTALAGYGLADLLKQPGVSPALPLPGQPTLTDEMTLLRQFQRKQQLASMRGRASTFLTGPRGIGRGLPSSDIATAFALAALNDPEYETTTGPEAIAAITDEAPADTGPAYVPPPEYTFINDEAGPRYVGPNGEIWNPPDVGGGG